MLNERQKALLAVLAELTKAINERLLVLSDGVFSWSKFVDFFRDAQKSLVPQPKTLSYKKMRRLRGLCFPYLSYALGDLFVTELRPDMEVLIEARFVSSLDNLTITDSGNHFLENLTTSGALVEKIKILVATMVTHEMILWIYVGDKR